MCTRLKSEMPNQNGMSLRQQPSQEEHALLGFPPPGEDNGKPSAHGKSESTMTSGTNSVKNEGEKKSSQGKEKKTSPLVSLHSQRFRICLLLMLTLFICLTIRVALSVSIVCMVDRRYSSEMTSFNMTTNQPKTRSSYTISSESEQVKQIDPAETCAIKGDLKWTGAQQSLLLSANFYGAFASVAFSGTLAEMLGAKRVLAVTISISSLLTLASPFLARSSYVAYLITRVIIGACEGFSIPALNLLASRWFPVTEKATVAAIYTSGTQLAAGFSSLAAAKVCQSTLLGGWPAVFYISGAIGVAFVIVWLLIVSDHPETSKLASQIEKDYLAERVIRKQKPTSVAAMPWSKILCSPAVHAIVLCSFAFGLSTSTMQSYLPSYLADLGLPIDTIGLYTLAPFISQAISKLFAGPAMDAISSSGVISITTATKIAQTIGSFGAATCLLLLAFIPNCERPFSAFVFLVIYGVVYAGGVCGFFTSLLAIAPLYTGTLSSFNQIFTMSASIATSVIVTLLTSLELENKWAYVFAIAAFFQAISGSYYLFCGTAEAQPWADPNSIKSVSDSSNIEEGCEKTDKGEEARKICN